MVSLPNLSVTVIQWLCVSLLISGVLSAQHVFVIDDTNRMKEAQDFYQKLENHLVRDNFTLFLLKSRLFFQVPSYSFVDVFKFTVCLSVGDKPVTNCSVLDVLWQPGDFNGSTEGSHYCWDFQWSNSAILGSLTIDLLVAFENIFVENIFWSIIGASLKHYDFTLSFHLQSPPCLSETDIEDVLVELLSWIKAYARSSGRPSSWDKRDKGYISKRYSTYWITESYEEKWAQWAHGIRVALLCAFTFLNVLIPMTLAKYSSWFGTVFKPRLTRSHQLVYWGTTIAFGVINISYILASLHKYRRTIHQLPHAFFQWHIPVKFLLAQVCTRLNSSIACENDTFPHHTCCGAPDCCMHTKASLSYTLLPISLCKRGGVFTKSHPYHCTVEHICFHSDYTRTSDFSFLYSTVCQPNCCYCIH